MRPSRFRILAFLAALSFAPIAHAEGPGIKFGDRWVLHLGLGAQVGYDSNLFFTASNTTGAFLFTLLPSLDLATRGTGAPHKLDFRLHAGMDYNEFLTGDSNISQHRSFGVQASVLATIMPGYKVSLDLLDNYVRTSQLPYGSTGTPQTFNINRDTNQVGFRLRIRPGGGRLELMISYVFGLDFFEEQQFKDLDVMYHIMALRLSWKFFPKTALYLDASDTPYVYPHPGATNHPNSFPLRIILGVQGLITPKLTTSIYVGYGNGFYQYAATATSTPNPNTGVAGISLIWKPFYSSTGSIGYHHDFVNSLLGSYYDLDSAFLSWTQGLWRFTGFVELNYSNIRYQGITDVSIMPTDRKDNLIVFNLRFDYPFKQWLTMSAGYTLSYNNASSKLALGPLGLIPADFLKHYVWLRLAVLY
jgi:hypothetical protein